MKKKTFIGALLFTAALLLTSCGASNNNNSNNLELLYFGKPKENIKPQRRLKLPNRFNAEGFESDEKNYDIGYGDGIDVEAYVKNDNRLAFLDIVLYSASTGKKYVFNEGNGDYQVETSTVLDNDLWTTRIQFPRIVWDLIGKESPTCFLDTYLEIEEINFLSVSGNITATNIAQSNVRRVDIHATDTDTNIHTWGDWQPYAQASCEEFGKKSHECSVCHRIELVDDTSLLPIGHSWSEWAKDRDASCELGEIHARSCANCGKKEEQEISMPAGHKCDKWTAQTKVKGLLQANDLVVGVCSVCQKTVQASLPNFPCLTSFRIPSDITQIASEAFMNSWGITSLTIPATVTSIGDRAFCCCYPLKSVYFESNTPPQIGSYLFEPIWTDDDLLNGFQIYVPCNSGQAYKSVNDESWQTYAVPRIIDHIVDEWTITKPYGCVEDGEKTGVCRLCHQTVTFPVPTPIGEHCYGEWHIGETSDYCEGFNQEVRVCENCGHTETRQTYDKHKFSYVNSVTNVDSKTIGVYKCSNCDSMMKTIDVKDYSSLNGTLDSSHKFSEGAVAKWNVPGVKGNVVIQFPVSIRNSGTFDPSSYIIKVKHGNNEQIEVPLLIKRETPYNELMSGAISSNFSMCAFDCGDTEGDLEIEFTHNIASYRLIFEGNIRVLMNINPNTAH